MSLNNFEIPVYPISGRGLFALFLFGYIRRIELTGRTNEIPSSITGGGPRNEVKALRQFAVAEAEAEVPLVPPWDCIGIVCL